MAPPDKDSVGEGTMPMHHSSDESNGGVNLSDLRSHPCDGSGSSSPAAVDQDHKACDEHTQGESAFGCFGCKQRIFCEKTRSFSLDVAVRSPIPHFPASPMQWVSRIFFPLLFTYCRRTKQSHATGVPAVNQCVLMVSVLVVLDTRGGRAYTAVQVRQQAYLQGGCLRGATSDGSFID